MTDQNDISPEQQRVNESVNEIVIALVNSFIERHTDGQNLNVDLTAMATGLESGRIARMSGMSDVVEIFSIVASAAPAEFQDTEKWHWPEELPIQEEVFAAETAALQDAENAAITQMRDDNIEPLHVALSLGMYAVHLAQNAKEHVDPQTVMGVFKVSCERGYAAFATN